MTPPAIANRLKEIEDALRRQAETELDAALFSPPRPAPVDWFQAKTMEGMERLIARMPELGPMPLEDFTAYDRMLFEYLRQPYRLKWAEAIRNAERVVLPLKVNESDLK